MKLKIDGLVFLSFSFKVLCARSYLLLVSYSVSYKCKTAFSIKFKTIKLRADA